MSLGGSLEVPQKTLLSKVSGDAPFTLLLQAHRSTDPVVSERVHELRQAPADRSGFWQAFLAHRPGFKADADLLLDRLTTTNTSLPKLEGLGECPSSLHGQLADEASFTGASFCLTNPRMWDNPIVLVNPEFESLTGCTSL